VERSALPTPECAPVRDLLATAVDEPLAVDDRSRVDGHLATCGACRQVQRGLAMDAAAIAHLPQVDAPARVVRAIEAGPRARGGVGPALAAAVLAFGLILVVGGGWLPLVTGPGTTARPATASATDGSPTTAASATPAPTDRPTSSTSPSPSPSSSSPSAAPTPPPTVLAFTGRLSRIDSPSLDGDAAAWAVAPWQGGAVAVGRSCETPTGAPRPCIATVWRSDGVGGWAKDTSGAPSPNADGVSMVGVASDGDRLVAVGNAHVGDEFMPVAWTSQDGSSWQRIDAPGGVEHGWILSVVASDDGFVAVGTAIQGGQALATAWHSPDGETWTVETDPPFDGGVTAAEPLADGTRNLVAGGMQDIDLRQDGRAVAVGARCRPDGAHCHPRLWVRGPGGTWQAVELGIDPATIGELTTVASLGDRTIAAGTDRAGRPIAFSSTDLADWRPMRIPDDTGPGGSGFTDLVAAGDQVIGFTIGGDQIGVWRWTPTVGWERIGDDGPAGRAILGSALINGNLVVSGRRAEGAALWIADEATP